MTDSLQLLMPVVLRCLKGPGVRDGYRLVTSSVLPTRR